MSTAKRLAEQTCSMYKELYGLDIKIARCFSFVGAHLPMNSYFAIGNFIRDAVNQKDIQITGDGTPIRSYLYAGDLCAWLWSILANGTSCRPYNVGSDQYLAMEELAKTITTQTASNTEISIAKKPSNTPNISRYVPDISRAKEELSLAVWTSLEDAISRTANWYKQKGEKDVAASPNQKSKRKTFIMDIDGVIANIAPNNDYNLSTPRQHNIDKINRLYEAGHTIILFTARGYVTGINWRDVTENQMQRWSVKYHELQLGKPAGDFYIDDRMVPLELFHQLTE